ncbi:MAG TPA: LysE family transporter [Flavobacteriaceae bacterium]|nr:LysE family transporter [Flavobacteriaceae bacterium]
MIIAFVGVIPPGLLNMAAAKISLKEGYSRGVMFSIGVCITVIIQTFVAVIFARYLSNHPDVINILERVALVIFVLISIYFFVFAKKEAKQDLEDDVKSKHSRFFFGMFLASLNVLPIPYQAYMSITLAGFGWLTFDKIDIASYVAGAATGTFVMLYIYIFFFDKIKDKSFTSQKNMNYIIGSITTIISIITLVNIIKEM